MGRLPLFQLKRPSGSVWEFIDFAVEKSPYSHNDNVVMCLTENPMDTP
jgi:hypothetical protein